MENGGVSEMGFPLLEFKDALLDGAVQRYLAFRIRSCLTLSGAHGKDAELIAFLMHPRTGDS